MRTQLFSRNVYLGVLLAVVLAFSVQGTADALTFGNTREGDLQTIVRDGPFSVTFAVNPVSTSTSLKSAYTNYQQDSTDTNRYFLDSTSGANDNNQYDSGESTVSTSQAFHYNNEAVRISVSGAGARITSIGTNDITPATSITLKDGGIGAEELVTSITVNCSTSNYGEVTITASDVTPSEDYPSGVRRAPNFVLTTYVVRFNQDVGTTRTIRLVGVTNGVAIGYDDQRDQPIYNGDSSHYPVTYSIEGSGILYIKEGERGASNLANRFGNATTPLFTSTAAKVLLNMTGTNTVTATLGGSFEKSQGIYIFGNPQLNITGGNNQSGAPNAVLPTALQVELRDSAGTPAGVAGVPIKFDVTDKSPSGGILSEADETEGTTIVDASNEVISSPLPGSTLYVQTEGTNGVANIDFQLGTVSGKQTVTASALGIARLTKTFTVTATPEAGTRQLFAEEIDRQGSTNIYTLVARVENGGQPDAGETVTFTTTKGLLTGKSLNTDGTLGATLTAKTVYESTNAAGKARIIYNIGDASGNAEVIASISVIEGTRITQLQEVTFNVRGGSSGGSGTDDPPDPDPTPTITFSPTSLSGAAGTTQSLTVNAGTGPARLVNAAAFISAGGTVTQGSGNNWSVTLPDTAGSNYRITFGASGYDDRTVPVIVTAPLANGTLTPTLGTRSGTQQPITVRAVRGGSVQSGVNITITGGATSYSRSTGTTGSISLILTLPTATSAHRLTVSATGYDPATITAAAPQQETEDTPQTPTETDTAAAADSIQISGEAFPTGTVNTALTQPLTVRVLDRNGNGVRDVKVTFRVTSGQGRLSQRGNGKAIPVQTDSRGEARAPYTPLSASSQVRVNAARVTQTVTFTITTDGASDAATPSATPSDTTTYNRGAEIPISLEGTLEFTNPRTLNGITYTCVGTGPCVVSNGLVTQGQIRSAPAKTTAPRVYKFGEEIPISMDDTLTFRGEHTVNGSIYTCVGPGECTVSNGLVTKGEIRVSAATVPTGATEMDIEVLRDADERPVMYWIAGGALYRQATGDATQIAASATDVAVGAQKLYWIQQTGDKTGAIHQANLDGSGAAVLKTLTAAPKGLALDRANKKLYLTNGWGKIQRMNLDATRYETNFITGLSDPMHIAVADGHVYWTEAGGRVRATNITGAKVPRNIVTGTGTLTGLAAGGGKVFWTEQTDKNKGRVGSANPDGTGVAVVYNVTASVYGLALEPPKNRLYWTNGWGKVQRSATATRYQDVVTGLMNPMAIAIGGANSAVAEETPKPSTLKTANKYDVNEDGTVDSKDSDALIVAVAAGITDAKYDVDGDGKVDFNDVVAVTNNRNGGSPGAPTLLGMKFSALEVDRLQEQIDLLVATNDRSPAALRTLVYLQQLIVMARPEKTQLLANYPNPFNPETWIPYELATDTDVTLTIYNAQGVVVRVLHLGQQSAGYYTDRERAAYWDGRNALGEQVASGIYFYQLETDDMSSLRKMVILK